MSCFPVAGQVRLQGRSAILQLQLPDVEADVTMSGQDAGANVTMSRPNVDELLAKIRDGGIEVHPSRLPMQRKTLTNALGNVQRGLLLPGGASGAWSPQAQVRLENFLLKPLMKTKANTPALPGSQPLAIEDKAPLTIEDKAPANASSSSDSSSDSSSSSDDSDAEQLAVDQGPASSAAAAPAEPVPMDVPVATQLIQAKEDFESIFAALHACQADLREAHQKIAEKEFQIAEKDSQIAMLERQLAEYQSETDDDALMTED